MAFNGDSIRISQLPQEVVDRIAAGEVVVRPVNAVKELVENSLDAGATEVHVSLSNGGLDLIRIQDNGRGIMREDMNLVCARFATSKLQAFEDLKAISTYGFRGEALASVSYVSRVSIVSRTKSDKCAHKGEYKADCTSIAGLVGTLINVKDLFYNAPSRLAALRYPQEEASRVIEMLIKYAIHYPSVSFSFHRLDGSSSGDFRSAGKGDQHATIRALLNAKVTKDLLNVRFEDERLHFSALICMASPTSLFTSTAIQSRLDRQKVFHLFINGRCVECPRLKQAIDTVFAANDAYCPFMTLSLEIEPNRVDVNVHPTKSVVYFLEQERIIERVEQEMHKLASEYRQRGMIELTNNNGRSGKNKPNDCSESPADLNRKRKNCSETEPLPKKSAEAPKAKNGNSNSKTRVRVDASNRRMEEFLYQNEAQCSSSPLSAKPTISQVHLVPILRFSESADSTLERMDLNETVRDEVFLESGSEDELLTLEKENANESTTSRRQSEPPARQSTSRMFEFQSLTELRRAICRRVDKELLKIFREHTLIGFYSSEYALIQSTSGVYLVHNEPVLREFFYQVVFSFGNMGAYELTTSALPSNEEAETVGTKTPLPVRDLLTLYMKGEEESYSVQLEGEIDSICAVLLAQRDMLWDYFSLKIDLKIDSICDGAEPPNLQLCTVPCLLDGLLPELPSVPRLLCELGRIDYNDEQNCYSSISSAFAQFFLPCMVEDGDDAYDEEEQSRLRAALRAIIFPALKNRFLPHTDLRKAAQQVTHIEEAFKQFGRC